MTAAAVGVGRPAPIVAPGVHASETNVPDLAAGAAIGGLVAWLVRRLMGDDVRQEQRDLRERMARVEERLTNVERSLERIERRLNTSED